MAPLPDFDRLKSESGRLLSQPWRWIDSSRKGRRIGFSGGGESPWLERGDGNGGAIASISGDEGFERDVIAVWKSVNDWDRFRYVDDAMLTVTDLGELS
jgi:hypothetical protein